MVMLVDVGNSRIKWSWRSELNQYALNHQGWQDAIKTLRQHLKLKHPSRLFLVHVLGNDFNNDLISLCVDLQIDLRLITANTKSLLISNGYEQSNQLGSDRFVALEGAVSEFVAQACIVIDCGTAITIDLVDADGNHLGGIILPGVRLWLKSLLNNTQELNQLGGYSKQVLATNTADGVSWGCINGLSAAIESIATQMEAQCSTPCKRIICGGDSTVLLDYLDPQTILRPHLVLQGLRHFSLSK
ncbi:MAG: type III pantothenate kinase [Thiotrichaceae bacterium]|nr:type III pantothenate kinase [Thiotrichaceae bacterium]